MFIRMLSAAAVFATFALAQTPPSLIRVHRAFDVQQSSPSAVISNPGLVTIALRSITGSRELWHVELHTSFGGMEEADKSQPPVFNTDAPTRTSVAFHRNWWSVRPEDAVQLLRRARYVQVTVIRIPVQAESELNELLRGRRASLDSINLDRPELVYQVVSGDQSGTFLILSPLPSLAVLDEGVSRSAAAYLRSTGSPSQRSGASNVKTELSYENLIFRIEPRLSTVTNDFSELDSTFWRGN